jgi:hypothetical protein
MIAFRASLIFVPSMAGAILVAGAQAQVGPPIRLTPPTAVQPREALPTQPSPSPDAPARPASAIEVSTPAPMDHESIGLLDEARGGFASNLWSTTTRGVIDPLVRRLVPSTSPTARNLAHRLLASVAAPPPGGGEPSFLTLRAERMLALGDVSGVSRLVALVPLANLDEGLARLGREARWLAGDSNGACGLARSWSTRSEQSDWFTALVACQAIAGDAARAELGLTLMRERGQEPDATFAQLIHNVAGDKTPLSRLDRPTPVHLALAAAAKLALPTDAPTGAAAPSLLALANSQANAIEFRLTAAERAEALGVIATPALLAIYDGLAGPTESLATSMSATQGPRLRANLHRALKATEPGRGRLEALRRAHRAARDGNFLAAYLRFAEPLVASVPPAVELGEFAPEAIRPLLLAGRIEDAHRWYDLARSAESPAGQVAAISMWPLMVLAGAEDRPDGDRLRRWIEHARRGDARDAASRMNLLATLFAGLGLTPNDPAAAALLGEGTGQTVTMPEPALWLALPAAAAAGRIAETTLISLAMLGADGPASTSPYALAAILSALRAVGLEKEAHALAIEAALAAGF